ncbi:lysophospholipid acyltransferase family protein [Alsobacter sp. R-9]
MSSETQQDGGSRVARPPGPPLLTRLEDVGFRIVAAVFRSLPLDASSALSGAIWRVVAPWLRRHRRADRNLAASIPELGPDERARILAGMWTVLGRTFAEAFQLDVLAADPDRIDLRIDPALLGRMRAGSMVLASMHSGNWEVAALAARKAGIPIAGVYQSLKNPLVDATVTGMRAPFYPLGLFTKGHETVFRLMRILRGGGTLAVLADLREHKGIAVPFFGRPAPTNPFPALIARSQGVPLVAVRVIRLDGARFAVEAEEVPVRQTADRSADVEATTAALHAVFERWIRERPEQWMWGHRRWG